MFFQITKPRYFQTDNSAKDTLDELVEERLINQYAAKHNITVSDNEVNVSAIGNYFGGVSINFKSTK